MDAPAPPGVAAHRAAAPDAVRCAVLTVSDSRTRETDSSGALIREILAAREHRTVAYKIVPDDAEAIVAAIEGWVADPEVQAILANGGTGIAARDTTYDALANLIDTRIDGFGELFRMLSYREIGAAAMLSRAVAGVYRGTLLVAMPGSTAAVRLAMMELIAPELGHLVYEIGK